MPNFQFFQLDVFTEKAFCGNPLAVFPDGTGITVEQMQQIAREMNLSETVFVLPTEHPDALRRLRIFTPTKELPIAGHPVVGTWNLLGRLGFIENAPRDGAVEIRHELGVGVLPVEIEFANGEPIQVTMTGGAFTPGEIVTDTSVLATMAAAFNFSPADFATDAPVQVAGIGVNFTIVPVSSLEVLRNARPNSAKLAELPKSLPGEFSLWTRETLESNSTIHTRMFAPEFGITEDPATGSAAGALGGYLVHHALLENLSEPSAIAGGFSRSNDLFKFTIEQGDFIDRPSRIKVEITGTKGDVKKVCIGGSSVVVAEGKLIL